MKKTKGFTLIELMIGIAIIGVLVAIAYPSYTNSLVKGNRANAKSLLLDVAQKQQSFLLDNRTYGSLTEITAVMGGSLPPEFTRFYTLSVTTDSGPPPEFQVRATPIAGTRQAGDGWLEVNQAGAKTSQFENKW